MENKNLDCARSGSANLDSARQRQIEASAAERERPFPVGKADEEDRFGKVAASPNLQNMSGRSLGDYLLLRCLGIGALGTAYLAQHRFLKRSFVVKVLDSELAQDSDFLNRFEREAAVLATLEHPNIVKVHNVSEADGRYFLVTDPVMDEKGETTNLYEYCRLKGGRVPEDEVVKIVHQIAAALDYTHEKGQATDPFAHLGLKPTNILISKKKEGINVQISDFGLSKVIGASNYMNRIYKALADKIGQTPKRSPNRIFLSSIIIYA